MYYGLIAQEFKTLIKTPTSLAIVIMPLVLLFGLGFIIPSGWIVPSSITIGIIAAILLYFGSCLQEIKSTSFMKSISLTELSKTMFFTIKVSFAVMVAFFAVGWVFFLTWLFTSPIPVLTNNFSKLISHSDGFSSMNMIRLVPFDMRWEEINVPLLMLSIILTIIIALCIAFLLVTFSKSNTSFYIASFVYIFFVVTIGGVILPPFLVSDDNDWFNSLRYLIPSYYTNNIMVSSFDNGVGLVADQLIAFGQQFTGNTLIQNASDEALQWVWVLFNGGKYPPADFTIDLSLFPEVTQWNVWTGHPDGQWLSPHSSIIERIDYFKSQIQLNNYQISDSDLAYFKFVEGAVTYDWNSWLSFVLPGMSDRQHKWILNNLIYESFNAGLLPILTTNVELSNQVLDGFNSIHRMFNNTRIEDYIIPPIEAAIFSAIIIKYFKWT